MLLPKLVDNRFQIKIGKEIQKKKRKRRRKKKQTIDSIKMNIFLVLLIEHLRTERKKKKEEKEMKI